MVSWLSDYSWRYLPPGFSFISSGRAVSGSVSRCLVFFGFALLLIGAFHTDALGVGRTIEGKIHGATATAAFWIFPAAILAMLPSLRKDPDWKSIFKYSIIACCLGVVLVVTLGILPDETSWFGLLERIVVANMILWVEVAAIKLLFLSVNRGQPAAAKEEIKETSVALS